jgi:uncharacterized damage-inducible protein DinB
MHPRLAELSEYLAQQRRALLEAAGVVPGELWPSRPGAGRWSVSEILEHLHRVERGTAALLTKRIASAREAGHPREGETSSLLSALAGYGLDDRTRTLEAPERVLPTENPDRETIEQRLADSRAALLAAMESGDGLALAEIRHTHPRLGELDLYQWILAVAEHEKRHTAQVRDVAMQLAPAT